MLSGGGERVFMILKKVKDHCVGVFRVLHESEGSRWTVGMQKNAKTTGTKANYANSICIVHAIDLCLHATE